ncbi:MAG TPA: DUF1287 domain-containing protein [Pyrinomonadaceae bacterium]|nr:DUF1287 domain-containing protein [Pyrinomonadaceae bacterium]
MLSRQKFVAPAIVGTLLLVTLLVAAGIDLFQGPKYPVFVTPDFIEPAVVTIPLPDNVSPQIGQLIASAIEQTQLTTGYDPAYVRIDYPYGDVPIETGVCSDVVVRAFRKAGIDLQKEVHEDMGRAWAEYPKKWGAAGRDTSIDHRRVGNLTTYFERQGKSRPVIPDPSQFLPGDIVSWDLGNKVDHIGIVVNVWAEQSERYLIVHNIGSGARMEDVLLNWEITGHYRYFAN